MAGFVACCCSDDQAKQPRFLWSGNRRVFSLQLIEWKMPRFLWVPQENENYDNIHQEVALFSWVADPGLRMKRAREIAGSQKLRESTTNSRIISQALSATEIAVYIENCARRARECSWNSRVLLGCVEISWSCRFFYGEPVQISTRRLFPCVPSGYSGTYLYRQVLREELAAK